MSSYAGQSGSVSSPVKPGLYTVITLCFKHFTGQMMQAACCTWCAACRRVLGDRSFSQPWGGSLLDSVIGTFLTQNVSDQLSSKAYMTLAATFPIKTVTPPTSSAYPTARATPPTVVSGTSPADNTASATPTAPCADCAASATPFANLAATAPAQHPNAAIDQDQAAELATAAEAASSGQCQAHSAVCASLDRVSAGTSKGAAGGVGPTDTADGAVVLSDRAAGAVAPGDRAAGAVVLGHRAAGAVASHERAVGAVVVSDRAAESSDSVDWEAVRVAPTVKVRLLAVMHCMHCIYTEQSI